MTKLRQLSGREVSSALRRFGFEVVAARGSHVKLRRILPDKQRQTLTIPLHDTLAAGTAHAIFKHASRYVSEAELRPIFFTD